MRQVGFAGSGPRGAALVTISKPQFEFLRETVRNRAAIVIEPGKEYLVESRLCPIAKEAGYDSPDSLLAQLMAAPAPAMVDRVIDAMTTNETSFVRDQHPFAALESEILPALIDARRTTRRLRIWSAACSSGQEPYTIAMLLDQHFPELRTWSVEILATDLSPTVLDIARNGVYSQVEVNRGLPANLLLEYFQRDGVSWSISDSIKRAVTFRRLNLIEPWPAMEPMDIVFIRNVMIYFDIETKVRIMTQMAKHLRTDGFLFLGAAESMIGVSDYFERHTSGKSVFYRPSEGR